MNESLLFTPIKINSMTLPNRTIMAPMVTNYAAPDGTVTDKLINYHVARAKGGVGLQIVEATYMDPSGSSYIRGLGCSDDYMIPGLKRLTDAVHDAGGHIAIQLQHGGQVAKPEFSKQATMVPSYIPGVTPYDDTHVMTKDDIDYIVRKYAEAAARAKKAGFDAVEIHGAHGYLILRFLSPYSNRRTDEYGGSLENRMRFCKEIVEAVREATGPDYPIILRLSIDELFDEGLQLEEGAQIAKEMVKSGVDLINASACTLETIYMSTPPPNMEFGWNAHRAKVVKDALDGAAPLSIVGRVHTRAIAERILNSGQADMVTIGRALIADPDLINKWQKNLEKDVIRCLSCNEGCIWPMAQRQPVKCAINPRVGSEAMYGHEKAKKAKKVVIIGGGIAGMSAALCAAERGHDVTLFEKSDKLGGLLNAAAVPPHRQGFKTLMKYYENKLADANVKLRLGEAATTENVTALKPDVTILASGSRPIVPSFCQGAKFLTAEDVLAGAPTGQKVLVVGGGLVGSETAEYLAAQGKDVTILELRDELAIDMEPRHRRFILLNLKEMGVKPLLNREVLEMGDGQIKVRDKHKREQWISGFDDIVLALGYRADNSLLPELQDAGLEVSVVGDSAKVGKVMNAVHDGFKTAWNI